MSKAPESKLNSKSEESDFKLTTRIKSDGYSALKELLTLKCEYLGDRVSRGVVVRLALIYYLDAARKLGSLPPVNKAAVKHR